MVIVVYALAGVIILAGCSSGETQNSPETSEEASALEEQASGPGQQIQEPTAEIGGYDATAEEVTRESRCFREREGELRIGDFEPPEEVPAYEIVEEKPVEREGAKVVRLLVDTRARSEEDYSLITRDIKIIYAELDAASVEFTDTTGTLSNNGVALIFNTPCGWDFMGYVNKPPSNDGYLVNVTRD